MRLWNGIAVVLIAGGLLAGCETATPQKYEARLERWVGSNVDDLVLAWGPPDGSFQLEDGRTVIGYKKSEVTSPGSDASLGIGGWSGGGRFGTGIGTSFPLGGSSLSRVETRVCETRFIVADRVVKAWSWEGNNCVSK